MNYEREFFDAIIDNVCIYGTTMDNIKYMYKEAYDILKYGGKIFSSAFSVKTTGYGTGERIEHNTYKNIEIGRIAGRGIFHFYEDGEIEKILSAIGFKNIIVEKTEYEDSGDTVSLFCAQEEK